MKKTEAHAKMLAVLRPLRFGDAVEKIEGHTYSDDPEPSPGSWKKVTQAEMDWIVKADANNQTRCASQFPPPLPHPLGMTISRGDFPKTPSPEKVRAAEELIKAYPGPDALAGGMPVSGTKYDGDKPRMDLLDPDWMEKVAQVLTFGAKKYAANNWRGGIAYSRLIAAAYRHLGAISRGEDIDKESGLPHVAHLSCCVMFLSGMMDTKPELDDRYKA